MVKSKLQLRNVQNVAASKTALIDLPIGPRYHYLVLQHGFAAGTNTVAGAATNISEVRVKANGRVQRVFSGTQLRDMNILNGTAFDGTGLPNTAPGVSIPIFFAEPWRMDEKDQDALAWATSMWSSFQIEVDLGAAGTPTLVASAVVDALPAQKNQGIVKVIRQQFPAAGTSFDIATIDRRDWLQVLSLYMDSGGSNPTTKVTVRINSQIIHELSFTANFALNTNWGMTPTASGRTASMTDLVFDHDALLGSAVLLDGVNDLTVTVEAGGAMSGTIVGLISRLGPVE
jgi:hypothetical protein